MPRRPSLSRPSKDERLDFVADDLVRIAVDTDPEITKIKSRLKTDISKMLRKGFKFGRGTKTRRVRSS